MLFALLYGTNIKRQPVPQNLIALDQKKETKACPGRKKFDLCAREECLKTQPIDVNAREV